MTLQERFWQKVRKTDNCWLWEGATLPNGYGQFNDEDKLSYAHRVSYRLTYGLIPEGKLVCHRCDVRNCVNPAHLFLGSHSDNMQDAVAKGRAARGTRQGLAKLTEDNVRTIRSSTESCYKLAKKFSVSHTTVREVIKRNRWKHI